MSEYTSLDLSKRLATTGFSETSDDRYNDAGTIPTDAYRSDTLLAWLVKGGYQVAVGHSYDKKRYTAFYTNEKGEQNTRRELADTIPDALAEVVMKVLEVKP